MYEELRPLAGLSVTSSCGLFCKVEKITKSFSKGVFDVLSNSLEAVYEARKNSHINKMI